MTWLEIVLTAYSAASTCAAIYFAFGMVSAHIDLWERDDTRGGLLD